MRLDNGNNTNLKNHQVEINKIIFDGDTFHSLLKYIFDNINFGRSLDEIKKSLIKSGWKSSIIDFLYDVEKNIDSSKLFSKKEILNTNFKCSKEDIEKLQSQLNSTIKDFSKSEGKLESFESKLSNFSERLDISKDSTSELRGMEISAEKKISEFENIIKKSELIIGNFDPMVLEKRFNLIEKKIDIQESNFMRFEEKSKIIDKNLKKYLNFMNKIKSESALLEILSNVKSSVDKIEDLKKDIDRKSGKIESIFLEFQGKLEILIKLKNKSEGNDEIIKDLIKDIDLITTKNKTFVNQENLAEKLDIINSTLESVKTVVFKTRK